ncbi:MAG: ABC transporter ATP-binding protein [Actinomycetota bacterium]|nr:ABC transporter ATP-binding protein [Actinomycetota bacterium]
MALFVDGKSTLIILGSLAVISSVLVPMRRRVSSRSRNTMNHQIQFAEQIAEISDLSLEIKALGVTREATGKLNDAISAEADASRRLNLLAGMMSPSYLVMAYGAILIALLFLSTIPTRDLNEVGAVMLIMLRSLSYGLQLEQGSIAINQFAPYAEKIVATRNEFRFGSESTGTIDIETIEEIELRSVNFSYPGRPPVLNEVSFRLSKGQVVGIVGSSGAGKTTLAQILLGLQAPVSGFLMVNGLDRTQISDSSWRRVAAYVPQDSKLLAGTIDDNVKFLREHVTVTDVDEALVAANLLLPVDRFPEGKNTDLGVAGRQFSGGQRQRLAVARALATKPSVLVLDEPTSSLDVESENVIIETMNRLKGSVTTIVVTHRESTLRACDRIFLVDQGTVTETTAERVTPDQLDDHR